MGKVLQCLYNVPCCGGFCAPTVNPDPSCFRHFSNEYTVPLSARFHTLLPCIETNAFCRTCGWFGIPWGDRHRKSLGAILATLNCLAMFLGLFAALGMTQIGSVLKSSHWVYGELVIDSLPEMALQRFPSLVENITSPLPIGVKFQIFAGVNMRLNVFNCRDARNSSLCRSWVSALKYTETESGLFHQEILWSNTNACGNGLGLDSGEILRNEKICKDCQGAQFANFALVMGVVTQWPTLLTNLQRSTRFGDINCQSTMGVLTNVWGTVMTLISFVLFANACHGKLPNSIGGRTLNWRFGAGYWCLLAATIVKIPDGIGHFIIPTPKQRWASPKDSFASAAEYMALRDDGDDDEAPAPKQESMDEDVSGQCKSGVVSGSTCHDTI